MLNKQLDQNTIKAIQAVLDKGNRVEIIPVKDGVKVMQIKREELKQSGNSL